MDVLFSSDNNYAPLCGVAIYSFLKNNVKDFDNIHIFILDGGISKDYKLKLLSICNLFDNEISLEFIKYDKLNELVGTEIKASRALSTYARLFSTSLLDDSIDKILYLDCDAIINDSFKELWNLNMGDYYCAAVLDAGPKYINYFLNLPENQEHFNAGMLLINLKSWRENNIEKKFLDYISQNNGEVFHNDQGVINVICKDNILKLHPKFNLLSPFFEIGYDKVLKWYNMSEYYSKDIIDGAIEKPIFIHLTTFVNGRPWFNNAKLHPLRKLFDEYASETPFKNMVYTNDNRKFLGKFFSFSYRYFPFSLICWMFRIYEFILIKKGTGSI